MLSLRLTGIIRRILFLALPLALVLLFLLPASAKAHAILIKSDPTQDAILAVPPEQVHMWFSENLNASTSSAYVMNSSGRHVDVNGSLILPTDARQMLVSLKPDLLSDVYVVVWRTQSADDGHVLSGSFLFSIRAPDGSVPKFKGTVPGLNSLNATTTGDNGPLDLPTLFSLLMVALVDLGTVFWVGAQLWRSFVPRDDSSQEQSNIERNAEERFDKLFSQPILRVLFLANIGVLLGQALILTSGQWSQVFSPTLLTGLMTNGRFGTFWAMREGVIALAMILSAYTKLSEQRSRIMNELIPWINLVLALALLTAITFSGHAAAVVGPVGIYAVVIDWLHLLAAALWIGGMLYLSLAYLPVLKGNTPVEQVRALLTTLSHFSPLAIAGVVIMAISGPFNATVHMTSWEQLYQTAYGRTLMVKVLLVGALLITSAIHVGILRPRLAKHYKKYQTLRENTKTEQNEEQVAQEATSIETKLLAQNIGQQTQRLSKILRWEPLLGVAVLLCTATMGIFAGTITPSTSPSTNQQQQVKPFTDTVKTSDGKFIITLIVSPNRFGPNTFTARVVDSNGKLDTNIGVSLYTTALDMDMGTNTVNLQADGKGNFSASADLDMPGHWQIRIQVRTPANTLSGATLTLTTTQ